MNCYAQYIVNKIKYININENYDSINGMQGGDSKLLSNIFNDIQLVHVIREYNPVKYKIVINNNRFQINELVTGDEDYTFGSMSPLGTAKIKTKEILDYDKVLNDRLMERLIDYNISYRGYIHCSWG